MVVASAFGFTAVAMGAFGAHGLKRWLNSAADANERFAWWETAAHYHLTHALALLGVAWLHSQVAGRSATAAGACFSAGILVFSGSLYLMTWTNLRWLGAITPIGGSLLLAGWVFLGLAAWQR